MYEKRGNVKNNRNLYFESLNLLIIFRLFEYKVKVSSVMKLYSLQLSNSTRETRSKVSLHPSSTIDRNYHATLKSILISSRKRIRKISSNKKKRGNVFKSVENFDCLKYRFRRKSLSNEGDGQPRKCIEVYPSIQLTGTSERERMVARF